MSERIFIGNGEAIEKEGLVEFRLGHVIRGEADLTPNLRQRIDEVEFRHIRHLSFVAKPLARMDSSLRLFSVYQPL